MSSKIIKNVKTNNVFKLREFSTVERGESAYNMRAFSDDEELSVQDKLITVEDEEPETIIRYEDEVTDKDYLPPSRLAKAEENIECETVELPEGKLGQGFVESEMFSDNEAMHEEENNTVIRSNGGDNQEDLADDEENELSQGRVYKDDKESKNILEAGEGEEFKPVLSEELISEEELNNLKNELQEYKEKVEQAENKAQDMEALKLTVERALMERDKQLEAKEAELVNLQNSMPAEIEKAKEEGRKAGYEEAKVEFAKTYEAEKADYLSKLDNFIQEALKKLDDINNAINAVDEQIPETVIGFVKSIIGVERKINDKFALQLIKENLSKLSEYRDISFSVNPEDLEVVSKGLPDYKVNSDISVPKGAVLVHSKSGEITLNSDKMIEELEKEINAQLRVIEKS